MARGSKNSSHPRVRKSPPVFLICSILTMKKQRSRTIKRSSSKLTPSCKLSILVVALYSVVTNVIIVQIAAITAVYSVLANDGLDDTVATADNASSNACDVAIVGCSLDQALTAINTNATSSQKNG